MWEPGSSSDNNILPVQESGDAFDEAGKVGGGLKATSGTGISMGGVRGRRKPPPKKTGGLWVHVNLHSYTHTHTHVCSEFRQESGGRKNR